MIFLIHSETRRLQTGISGGIVDKTGVVSCRNLDYLPKIQHRALFMKENSFGL